MPAVVPIADTRSDHHLRTRVKCDGYTFFQLPDNATPSPFFAQNWDRLHKDEYLQSDFIFRYRRFSDFIYHRDTESLFLLQPHGPFFQGKDLNSYAGGIARFFEPLEESFIQESCFLNTVRYAAAQVPSDTNDFKLTVHAFRVVANQSNLGLPTPEGIHRDGADFFIVSFIGRSNVTGGISRIYDDNKILIDEHTFQEPGDSVLVNDRFCYHDVTPIRPIDPNQPAYRDVMIINFYGLPKLM